MGPHVLLAALARVRADVNRASGRARSLSRFLARAPRGVALRRAGAILAFEPGTDQRLCLGVVGMRGTPVGLGLHDWRDILLTPSGHHPIQRIVCRKLARYA
jgi:hypothetical protein